MLAAQSYSLLLTSPHLTQGCPSPMCMAASCLYAHVAIAPLLVLSWTSRQVLLLLAIIVPALRCRCSTRCTRRLTAFRIAGPVLLEGFQLIEKVAQFTREVPAEQSAYTGHTWGRLMPSCLIWEMGRQQSSMCSWNQRHTPFQGRRGSMASALRTIAMLERPQKAGSSCVLKSSTGQCPLDTDTAQASSQVSHLDFTQTCDSSDAERAHHCNACQTLKSTLVIGNGDLDLSLISLCVSLHPPFPCIHISRYSKTHMHPTHGPVHIFGGGSSIWAW